jgi:glycosyltransferase involved in cell wall biosynthesis
VADTRPTILLVSPYRSEYGPVRRSLAQVTAAFDLGGYRTVAAVPAGSVIPDVVRERATIYEIPDLTTFPRTVNVIRLGNFFQQHFAAATRIEQIGIREGARLVYSLGEAIFCGSLAARRLQVPSVVHAIGMSIQSPRIGAHVYIGLLDRVTDRFVSCSSAVAEMLADYGIDDLKSTVVHNGVDVREIEQSRGLPSPIDHDGPRIGMVAAWDPRKGHELFVEAAALIAARYPAVRFYLIGGVLQGQAESLAFEQRIRLLIRRLRLDDHVVAPGYVPAPEVYAWIRALDVVVVPSRTEAFAHALLEAMALRKPVVATRIEGNLDAFVHGHSGVYVDPGPRAVADAVSDLLEDPERARALGDAAYDRARLLFDLEQTLPALSHTLSLLLEGAPTDGAAPAVGAEPVATAER